MPITTPTYPLSLPTIVHVDINSYFATMLQQENPHLRGKPVGVTKDHGRSCVIAASKEAKKFGVETGSGLAEARERCPDLITVPAAFERYLSATRELNSIFKSFSPEVYIYSLDEAFIDVSRCRQYLYPDVSQFGAAVQQEIKKRLGEWVTCNVGISYNRLLAKMASETAPKGEIQIITPELSDGLLATTTFKDVCGVGYRLEKKLATLGVTTPYQIRFVSDEDLLNLVGPFWCKELRRISLGESSFNLTLIDRPQPHMKSVGRSITGFKTYSAVTDIKAILLNLTEEVTHKVRTMNMAGRYIWYKLYGHDRQWVAHQTLSHYVRHTSEMEKFLTDSLPSFTQQPFAVIKFAVRLGLLKPISEVPIPLYEPWHQQEAKYQAMDAVNQKYGLFTLHSGALLNRPVIKPEVTGFLGDRIYYGL